MQICPERKYVHWPTATYCLRAAATGSHLVNGTEALITRLSVGLGAASPATHSFPVLVA